MRTCQTFVIIHFDGLSYVTKSPVVFKRVLQNCQLTVVEGSQEAWPGFLTVWTIFPCMSYAVLILSINWPSEHFPVLCHFVSVIGVYLNFLATFDSHFLLEMVSIRP